MEKQHYRKLPLAWTNGKQAVR